MPNHPDDRDQEATRPTSPHSQASAAELIAEAKRLFGLAVGSPELKKNQALAAERAEQALEAARQQGDQENAARALNLLADGERLEGRMDAAAGHAEKAVNCARAANDLRTEADAVHTLGLVAMQKGQLDSAVELLKQALKLHEQLGAEACVASGCGNLALAYWQRGDLAHAMPLQERSLEIRLRSPDRREVGASYLNLGLIHADLGDWDKALECYFRALAEEEALGNRTNAALCYNNIGELYLNRGKLEPARYHLEKALELSGAEHQSWVEAEILGTSGEAAYAAGDFGRAQGFYERNLAVCTETGDDEELAETLRRWAELDLVRGEVEVSRTRLEKALGVCTGAGLAREEGNVRRVLGEVLAASGDTRAAVDSLEQSTAILRRLGRNYELGRSLLELGRLRLTVEALPDEPGRIDAQRPSALALLGEAAAIFRDLGARDRAREAEGLAGSRGQGEAAELLQGLIGLAGKGLERSRYCEAVLELLVRELRLRAASILVRDGEVYSHGSVVDPIREAERAVETKAQTFGLEAGGRRTGTLILYGGVEYSRLGAVRDAVALGLAQSRARQPAAALRTEARFPGVIGADTTLRPVFRLVEQVAPAKASVLILGESGTGKELVARVLHQLSGRKGRFAAVNCAAIPEALLESELFGIEKGTATGVTERKGKLESAEGGTLFLDEVGDMSLGLQAKMLRVLQERSFERVGGRQAVPVDVRVVAATNRDLNQAMDQGEFRRDLFYRLNVVSVELPPLRERKQDLPALVAHFVERFASEYSKPVSGASDECLARLLAGSWPGNVRELENVIERAVILCQGTTIDVPDLPPGLGEEAAPEPSWKGARDQAGAEAEAQVEKGALAAALENSGWVVKRAAARLGISRRQIYRLIEKHGLKRPKL